MFLLVLLQPEVVEALLEDRGLVHIQDVDDDLGFVFAREASHVFEVDSGVCSFDDKGVFLDELKVQGLQKEKTQ